MTSIARNTQGAVIVIATFMAAIAIGLLYYFMGLGDMMVAQERLQDAADASAFSAAVIHARGMNILALLNIIMASVLAIVVLLSMLASLLQAAAIGLAIAAFFAPPLYAGVAPLRAQAVLAKKTETGMKKNVEGVLRAVHAIQGPLNRAIPILASTHALKLARDHYGPVVQAGATFPIFSGLPTVDGRFDTLCSHAGALAGEMVSVPLKAVLSLLGDRVGNYVAQFLGAKAKSLGAVYAKFYCGGRTKPTSPSFEVKKGIPELKTADGRECQSGEHSTQSESACARYRHQIESIRKSFDFEIGECIGEGDTLRMCKQMIRRARRECNHNQVGRRTDYRWREATVTRHFVLRGQGNTLRVEEVGVRKETGIERQASDLRSIGIGDMCRLKSSENNASTEFGEWNEGPEGPVCSTNDDVPTVEEMTLQRITEVYVEHREISDVLGCARRELITADFRGGVASPQMKKQTPRDMCNCAVMGGEMFQVRSIVYGDADEYTGEANLKIRIATDEEPEVPGFAGAMAQWSGRFGVAQAEYFFDKKGTPKQEWMWSMHWKARLRRLHKSQLSPCMARKDTCPGFAKASTRSTDSLYGVTRFKTILNSGTGVAIGH